MTRKSVNLEQRVLQAVLSAAALPPRHRFDQYQEPVMLTNAAIKAARAGARPRKLWDEAGLHLLVLPSGRKSWRLRLRRGASETVMTIGAWPDMTIDQARDRRDAVRSQVRAGGNLRDIVRSAEVRTFEHAARAWHGLMEPEWSPVHAVDVVASLERDVFAAIGGHALNAITRPAVLEVLRQVERRGRRETARRLRQRVSAVFEYAMSEGWCEDNPAAVVRRAMLKPAAQQKQPALTDVDDLRGLIAAVEGLVADPAVKLASRFLALTAVRLAAVRGARWEEIEDVDGDSPLWRVPAARMKLAAGKKRSAEHDHLVPLAPATVAVLRQSATHGACGLIFPGRTGRALGEGAIGSLYIRAGYASRHVPHGWRASFSTILNETLGDEWSAAIDRALAHVPKDKVEAAYNRAEQLGRRRELFVRWAEMLG